MKDISDYLEGRLLGRRLHRWEYDVKRGLYTISKTVNSIQLLHKWGVVNIIHNVGVW
jgi:hypothetical protein